MFYSRHKSNQTMLTALRKLATAAAIAGGLVGSAVAILTVASIAGRAIASRPIPGDIELTQMGISIAISLCLPWCQIQGANIIVDFFTQHARNRTRQRLDAVGALLMAVFCALLSWRSAAGAFAVASAGETTMILDVPMWIGYAAVAPGLGLTALIALIQAKGLWVGTLDALDPVLEVVGAPAAGAPANGGAS
jgi:TRAP-type C4-dicarboxylate transport system permease small subunit